MARRYKAKLSAERQRHLDAEVELEELDEVLLALDISFDAVLNLILFEDAMAAMCTCCPGSCCKTEGNHRTVRVSSYFALPKSWTHSTIITVSATMALQMTILIIGVVVMDSMALVEPRTIWFGHKTHHHHPLPSHSPVMHTPH